MTRSDKRQLSCRDYANFSVFQSIEFSDAGALTVSNTLPTGFQRKRPTEAPRAGPRDATRKPTRPSVAPYEIEEAHRNRQMERPTSQISPSTCETPGAAVNNTAYSLIEVATVDKLDADDLEKMRIPREAMKGHEARGSARAGALSSSSRS